MKTISEVWVKGELISRKEYDDGIPSIEDLEKRIVELEKR